MKARFIIALILSVCFNVNAQDKLIDQALNNKKNDSSGLYKVVVDNKERIYFDDLTESISKRGYLLVDAQTKMEFIFGEFRRMVSSFSFYCGDVSLKKFTYSIAPDFDKKVDFIKLINNHKFDEITRLFEELHYSGPIPQLPYNNVPVLNFLKKINFGAILSIYYDDNDNIIVSQNTGDEFIKIYHNFSLVHMYQNGLVKKNPKAKVNYSKNGDKITLTSEYFPEELVVKLNSKSRLQKDEMKKIMQSISNRNPAKEISVNNRKIEVQYYYVDDNVVAYNENEVTKLINTINNQEIALEKKYNLYSQYFDGCMYYISKGNYCEFIKISANKWFSLYNDVNSYLQNLAEINDYNKYTEFMLNLFDSQTLNVETVEELHQAYFSNFKNVGIEKYQVEDRIFIAKNPDKKPEYNTYVEKRRSAISESKLHSSKIFKDYKEGFYIGEMNNGVRQGNGRFVYKDFNEYNNSKIGSTQFSDNFLPYEEWFLEYEGTWLNDKPHGFGTTKYRREDYGIVIGLSRPIINGKYKNGLLEGFGTIIFGGLLGGETDFIFRKGKPIERLEKTINHKGYLISLIEDDNRVGDKKTTYKYVITKNSDVVKYVDLYWNNRRHKEFPLYISSNNYNGIYEVIQYSKDKNYGKVYTKYGGLIGIATVNGSFSTRKALEIIICDWINGGLLK